jgi:S1-C subfamily serine protease
MSNARRIFNGWDTYHSLTFGLFFKSGTPRIERIGQGTPAEAAGIQAGDVLLEADGHRISGIADFASVLNTKQPGDTVTLQIERNGQPMIFTVTTVAEPE